MAAVELLPEGVAAVEPSAIDVEWPTTPGRRTEHADIDVDMWFTRFGAVPPAAVDLARIGVAAFVADQVIRRSTVTWSRDIRLVVHACAPERTASALQIFESLLFWVTGDSWTIELVEDTTAPQTLPAETRLTNVVSLLSGGVDSFCGAVFAPEGRAFLGHWDNTAVKRSQNRVATRLGQFRGAEIDYTQVLVQAVVDGKKDRSTRTRSVMFTSLGTALAAARGARRLVVPENGFTSLNPPLAPNRGGPHTTRSTHPTTFALTNALNEALGIPVVLDNPHEWDTKGELIAQVVSVSGRDWLEETLPQTLSCATLNGHRFKGGNPNLNCGVCVACMTRRGAIQTAELSDRTEYLVNTLQGPALEQFLLQRGRDIPVVRACDGWRPNPATLIAMGPFAPGFDYERGQNLLARGLEELVRGLP